MSAWIALALAILAEIIATSAMPASAGFSKLWPSLIVIVGYALAFYFLSLAIKSIPLGIAYAIWSGVGITLITLIALLLYRQKPDLPALIGMGLIISGVLVIHLFSKSTH